MINVSLVILHMTTRLLFFVMEPLFYFKKNIFIIRGTFTCTKEKHTFTVTKEEIVLPLFLTSTLLTGFT